MYNLVIRKCTSPPLLVQRLKIFKWKFTTPPGLNPGPAELEADMLPSESAWQAYFINVTMIFKFTWNAWRELWHPCGIVTENGWTALWFITIITRIFQHLVLGHQIPWRAVMTIHCYVFSMWWWLWQSAAGRPWLVCTQLGILIWSICTFWLTIASGVDGDTGSIATLEHVGWAPGQMDIVCNIVELTFLKL